MTATILVVDDIELNVKVLTEKLLSEYYVVETASNGYEALQVLKEKKIDIVLLDVMMPGINGFETCQMIKKNPETVHIPVVMVTALSEIEDRIKGLESGADEFLTKPVKDVPLFARIKSLANVKRIIDELKLRNKTNEELGSSAIELGEDFSSCKIAIYDDDIVEARNMKRYLSAKLTEHIKIVADQKEMDALGVFIPDLVMISCELDVGDPLRIAVITRSRSDTKNSVVMLLAAEENTHMVIKGMELGANDYCIYPVDESELIARVKTQLKRKLYQDRLRRELEESVDLSIKDGLTRVFNRRYFDVHIEKIVAQAKERKKEFCLLMLDIDHFKKVNDTYGHQSGDAVLKTMSSCVKKMCKVTDLVARYGGEEFVVVLLDTNIDMAKDVAERLRLAVQETECKIPAQEAPLKITVSIGIASYNMNDNPGQLVERADKGLYKAKEDGRNRFVVVDVAAP